MARPRGYATWNPKPATLALVGAVESVLTEYEAHLPLTVRQIFYRLVGAHDYPKDERAYARLCETLVRARRAQMIPFDSIRDDGTIGAAPQTFDGVGDFWDGVRSDLSHYSRDRLNGQDVRIELWCEAGGMVPQLRRVAFPFSVPVYSTGGFSSVTVTHEIAQRALSFDKPTVFLHVGDFDPSGESIFDAMTEDAERFVLQHRLEELDQDRATFAELRALDGAQLRPLRVALTEEQVHEHDLPTAPPKRSDTRSRNWIGDTCQAEAMPPDLLAQTVQNAIEAQLDLARYEEECDAEAADRDRIGAVLGGVPKAGE